MAYIKDFKKIALFLLILFLATPVVLGNANMKCDGILRSRVGVCQFADSDGDCLTGPSDLTAINGLVNNNKGIFSVKPNNGDTFDLNGDQIVTLSDFILFVDMFEGRTDGLWGLPKEIEVVTTDSIDMNKLNTYTIKVKNHQGKPSAGIGVEFILDPSSEVQDVELIGLDPCKDPIYFWDEEKNGTHVYNITNKISEGGETSIVILPKESGNLKLFLKIQADTKKGFDEVNKTVDIVVDEPLQIISTPGSAVVNLLYTYNVETNKLSVCSLTEKPNWMSIDSNIISGTPVHISNSDVGYYHVVVECSSGAETVLQEFDMEIDIGEFSRNSGLSYDHVQFVDLVDITPMQTSIIRRNFRASSIQETSKSCGKIQHGEFKCVHGRSVFCADGQRMMADNCKQSGKACDIVTGQCVAEIGKSGRKIVTSSEPSYNQFSSGGNEDVVLVCETGSCPDVFRDNNGHLETKAIGVQNSLNELLSLTQTDVFEEYIDKPVEIHFHYDSTCPNVIALGKSMGNMMCDYEYNNILEFRIFGCITLDLKYPSACTVPGYYNTPETIEANEVVLHEYVHTTLYGQMTTPVQENFAYPIGIVLTHFNGRLPELDSFCEMDEAELYEYSPWDFKFMKDLCVNYGFDIDDLDLVLPVVRQKIIEDPAHNPTKSIYPSVLKCIFDKAVGVSTYSEFVNGICKNDLHGSLCMCDDGCTLPANPGHILNIEPGYCGDTV